MYSSPRMRLCVPHPNPILRRSVSPLPEREESIEQHARDMTGGQRTETAREAFRLPMERSCQQERQQKIPDLKTRGRKRQTRACMKGHYRVGKPLRPTGLSIASVHPTGLYNACAGHYDKAGYGWGPALNEGAGLPSWGNGLPNPFSPASSAVSIPLSTWPCGHARMKPESARHHCAQQLPRHRPALIYRAGSIHPCMKSGHLAENQTVEGTPRAWWEEVVRKGWI